MTGTTFAWSCFVAFILIIALWVWYRHAERSDEERAQSDWDAAVQRKIDAAAEAIAADICGTPMPRADEAPEAPRARPVRKRRKAPRPRRTAKQVKAIHKMRKRKRK